MLDIKKVYIDTRFKTPDSKSDSDFFIELPRSLNVPEDCICYLTDIVIPVSWSTIDSRNNTLYVCTDYTDQPSFGLRGHPVILPSKNYTGVSFAAALKTALNAMNTVYYDKLVFDVVYDANDNEIMIGQINHPECLVYLVSSADFQAGSTWFKRCSGRDSPEQCAVSQDDSSRRDDRTQRRTHGTNRKCLLPEGQMYGRRQSHRTYGIRLCRRCDRRVLVPRILVDSP